jgi:hypothetical protein
MYVNNNLFERIQLAGKARGVKMCQEELSCSPKRLRRFQNFLSTSNITFKTSEKCQVKDGRKKVEKLLLKPSQNELFIDGRFEKVYSISCRTEQ